MILVFDLYGTPIDGAVSIQVAVNHMLAETSAIPLTFAQARSLIGDSEVTAETPQAAAVPFGTFTEDHSKPLIDDFPYRICFSRFAGASTQPDACLSIGRKADCDHRQNPASRKGQSCAGGDFP